MLDEENLKEVIRLLDEADVPREDRTIWIERELYVWMLEREYSDYR